MSKYSAKGTRVYIGIADNPLTVLVNGKRYLILTYVSDDDFSNLGATNVTGNEFVASGTTPTHWAHGSVLASVELIPQVGDVELDLGERIGLIDVTTHDASTDTRTKLDAGFKEPAKINFELVYDPGDTAAEAMRVAHDTYAVRTCMIKLTDPSWAQWYGSVRVASFTIGAPVADKLSSRVSLEILAASTFTA